MPDYVARNNSLSCLAQVICLRSRQQLSKSRSLRWIGLSSTFQSQSIVGRTPWSARVPLDPLLERKDRPGGRSRTLGSAPQ